VTFLIKMNTNQLKAIPEHIKNHVLNWACDLEAAGVTGDGMSFSPMEKATAQNVVFNINNSHIEQLSNSGVNRRIQ
jgi:AbiTii